jgi:hypothetical protein
MVRRSSGEASTLRPQWAITRAAATSSSFLSEFGADGRSGSTAGPTSSSRSRFVSRATTWSMF